MPNRIKVKLNRKAYVVVRDATGVIRIEYVNAVSGRCALDLTGRTAKAVLKKLAAEMNDACPRELAGCIPGY